MVKKIVMIFLILFSLTQIIIRVQEEKHHKEDILMMVTLLTGELMEKMVLEIEKAHLEKEVLESVGKIRIRRKGEDI